MKAITVFEHDYIYRGIKGLSKNELSESEFDDIEKFVVGNPKNDSDGDSAKFALLPSVYNNRKALKAKQYVGVIQTKKGTVVEILPKIGDIEGEVETRKILIRMLKHLKNSNFKNIDTANLKTTNMTLLEIFISMFCDELDKLIKKGIKSDYIEVEENSKVLKGQLQFSQNIVKNIVHKERFYVKFDEFSEDRIENRIIKTAILFLLKKSNREVNKKRLRHLHSFFSNISKVHDIHNAFSSIKLNRQIVHYEQTITWCKIFLFNESFTSVKGNSVAFALLFDMNKVFEDYVAFCLKRDFPNEKIKTQIASKYLLEKPKKEFQLKPDIYFPDKDIIADTKWKILDKDNTKHHFGISQADIYQMYAYGKKYDVKNLWLIYPYTEKFPDTKMYKFEDCLTLRIMAFHFGKDKLYKQEEVFKLFNKDKECNHLDSE